MPGNQQFKIVAGQNHNCTTKYRC